MDVTAFVGTTRVPISAVDNGDGTYSLKTTGGGSGGSTVDRELVVTVYRAKAAGTGYSVGDTITAVRYINVSTGTPAQEGATAWYNETTAAVIGSPAAANIEVAGQPGLTDAQLRASAVSVSAAALPLPAGAATEATLAAASAKLPATLGQKAKSASMSVAVASDQSAVTSTDKSGNIAAGGTAQTAIALNANRRAFWIQNLSAGDLWISDVGTATAASPSLKIVAGGLYESMPGNCPTSAISIIGATTSQAFSAREYT